MFADPMGKPLAAFMSATQPPFIPLRRDAEVVSAHRFGATGTGIHDDTEAFVAYMAWFRWQLAGDNPQRIWKLGQMLRYRISTTLDFTGLSDIIFDGGRSIIISTVSQAPIIDALGASGCIIRDLYLEAGTRFDPALVGLRVGLNTRNSPSKNIRTINVSISGYYSLCCLLTLGESVLDETGLHISNLEFEGKERHSEPDNLGLPSSAAEYALQLPESHDSADQQLAQRESNSVGYRPARALDLDRTEQSALLAGVAEGVWIAPPGEVRIFSRGKPNFIDDPDQAMLFSDILSSSMVQYPPVYMAGLFGALLIGYRTILTNDKKLLNDDSRINIDAMLESVSRMGGADTFANEETGLIARGNNFILTSDGRAHKRLTRPTLVLCSHEPSNYGSFLFRVLPKLVIFNGNIPDMDVLAYVGHQSQFDLLELAGVSRSRIIAHDPNIIYQIDRGIYPGLRNPDGYLDPETQNFFADLRTRVAHSDVPTLRIYVSRRGTTSNGRRMINEEELEIALMGKGFEIVRPHEMSALKQIKMFANARVVIGPSGAGLFNCVFCHPGTILVDIESEPHWIHAHACLFTSCNLHWGVFEGKTLDGDYSVHHKPFYVNIPALLNRVDRLEMA